METLAAIAVGIMAGAVILLWVALFTILNDILNDRP